jgi:3-hydroxyacyl-CoA dehydrogenase/enoyl-CoA hydratase/3-hydroxybutyryl-CoA epimerase
MMEAKMLGRKSGSGFYLHGKGEAHPNPAIARFAPGQSAAGISRQELQERMTLLMVNESARCLEEQIVTAPEDVDFAMINGTGFAPFRGGPLRYADSLGAQRVVGAMNKLVERGAEHFAPCELLKQMAAGGKKFYGN